MNHRANLKSSSYTSSGLFVNTKAEHLKLISDGLCGRRKLKAEKLNAER
jgi:hypothetical protein